MADGGTIDLNKLKQVVDVETILDKRKLNAVLKTLETSLSGENISKYFKGTDTLLDDLQEAYKKFNRSMSDTDAKNLVNINNILKALKVDTASLVPNFEEIGTVIEKAEQKSKGLRGIIKVKDFKDVFVALNQFKEYGLDIEEIFGKLGAKGNFSELTEQLEQQAQTIERYRNKVSALRDELRNAENASGVSDLKDKLSNLTADARDTFEAFLKLNNIGRMDEWGYYDSSKFSEYFDAIKNGSMSAQEAIAKFKAEYGYLLEDSFKNSNNSFGLEQLKIFQDTLDQVLTTVEDFHRKLDTLPDDMKNIQSSGKSDQVLFDEEQLKSVLSVFSEIKDSLSSLRSVVSDVGDGEELSPLLQMIKNVEIAVSSLNTAMSKIKLNINIESQGTDEQLLAKIEERKQTLLAAYRDQFNAMRQVKPSGMTVVGSMKRAKESSATISALNKSVNTFSEDDFDNIDQKIAAYVNIIQKLKRLSELSYGENIYENMDKSFQNKVSFAKGMLTKANNTIGSNVPEGLEGLFGGKTDLSEVIEQLKLIVVELGKVSAAAVDIKTSLGDGIQLNDSLQQIESLTQKVQNLEAKLTSLKSSTSFPSTETNISYQNQLKTIRELSAEKQKLQEQDRKSEVNQALKDQLYAYKQIQSIREKIASTDDENLIAELEKQKQTYQEQYLTATKILKNNSDLYNSESRLNELLQIGLKTTQKISEAEIKRNSAADNKKAKEWDDVNAKNQADIWKENQKAIQNYVNAVKKLQDLLAEDKGTGSKAAAIEKQQGKIKQLEEEALNARAILSSMVNPHTSDASTWDAWVKTMDKLSDASHDAKAAVDDVKKSIQAALTSEYKSMNDGLADYEAKIRSFNSRKPEDRKSDYSTALNGYTDALERYRNELQKIQNHPELINETEINNLKNMRQELDKAATSLKGIDKGSTAISRDKMINKISDYMKKNSAMSKEFKSELEGLIQKLKTLGAEADTTRIADEFFKITQRIREAGQEGKKFWDVVKEKAWYGLAGTIGTYFGFNDLIQYGKQGVQIVRELDTQLTEMMKVSNESVQSLKNYQNTTFDVADTVGTTAKQIQASTADYMRLGESLDEAAESAKTANILLNVSEFSNIEDATKSLVAMGQAYKNLDKLTIVDKLNEVGKLIAQTYSNV